MEAQRWSAIIKDTLTAVIFFQRHRLYSKKVPQYSKICCSSNLDLQSDLLEFCRAKKQDFVSVEKIRKSYVDTVHCTL